MDEELKQLAKAFEDISEDEIADQLEKGCYPIIAISEVEGRAQRMLAVCKRANDLLATLQGRSNA